MRASFTWLVTGRQVPDKARLILGQPLTALVIAVLALLIGIVGSLFSPEIRSSTARFLTFEGGRTSLLVVGFWISCLLWAVLFYMRLIAESDEKKSLEQAIHRCPNPQILRHYKRIYDSVDSAVRETAQLELLPENLEPFGDALVKALQQVQAFCREFSDPVPGALRGCNVMLVRKAPFPGALVRRLRFHPTGVDPASLHAILDMPRKLVVCSGTDAHVDPIALPVPREATGRLGTNRVLPGAPWSLHTGQLSVHRDTRKLASECSDMDGEVRRELDEYFGAHGAGRHVRSFASARVGTGENPVAVLNFDYSEPGLLGPEEYYGTFFALLVPLLQLLRDPLDRYAALEHLFGAESTQ